MKQIDLDDLPPRVAEALAGLADGEELVLVRGGLVVARLRATAAPAPASEPPASEESMKEIMEHFNDMIHDDF
jgi:antitoxin (DNA-binding transcriptional repressor) of toxin-antitoxin stability system